MYQQLAQAIMYGALEADKKWVLQYLFYIGTDFSCMERCIPAAASKECDSPSECLNADQMEDGEFVVTKNGVLVPDHPFGSQQGIVRIRSLAT